LRSQFFSTEKYFVTLSPNSAAAELGERSCK